MSAKLERIYWLYQQLKGNRYPSRTGYCRRYEVAASSFKRDLEFLRHRLLAPIAYDRRHNGYRLTEESFELPSYWFNPPALLFLAAACNQLRHLEGGSFGGLAEKIENLLRLHHSEMPAMVSCESVGWVPCRGDHLDILLEAMLDRRLISLVYHVGHSDRINHDSPRKVEPYRLHHYMGSWYLVGYCHQRREARIFHAGRIVELKLCQETFARPRFDVDRHIRQSYGIFKGGRELREITLKFDPYMARFVGGMFWHPEQCGESTPDGGLRLTIPVADFTEITMRILSFGRHVEVLAPEELRQRVAEEVGEMGKKTLPGRGNPPKKIV